MVRMAATLAVFMLVLFLVIMAVGMLTLEGYL